MKYRNHLLNALIVLSFLSCQKETVGPAGLNSLVNLVNEAAGTNCPNGGLRVESGLDKNSDGVLTANEVTQTKYLCNGANGLNSLSSLVVEPTGPNCQSGGYKFQTGVDLNNNSILDANEVQATKYICGVQPDKLERLQINMHGTSTNGTNWMPFFNASETLIKFNKLNYNNVDSITFLAIVRLSAIQPGFGNFRGSVDLFNITDNTVINHSQIDKHDTYVIYDYAFMETRNIYNDLPAKEINLGVRLKAATSNDIIDIGTCYVFIYRH